MDAWLDRREHLWVMLEEGTEVNCHKASKTVLVGVCEELDLGPSVLREYPSYRIMRLELLLSYEFTKQEVRYMDRDMVEFYWDWCDSSADEVCQALYDYFCSYDVLSSNCSIDRDIASVLPSIFKTPPMASRNVLSVEHR